MTLVQAWKDSLSLLKPKHLHLFALVTLKSIVSAYKVLLKYWWWLYALIITCHVASYYDVISLSSPMCESIMYMAYGVLYIAIVLSTRPSLKQKNCAYFRQYAVYCLPMLIFWSVVRYSYISFIVLFFFLDSNKQLNQWPVSLFRAIKMFIYNLPLFFIIDVSIYFVASTLVDAFSVPLIMVDLMSPLFICIYMNIYIKKLHDQFDLYFNQPQ